MRQEINHLHSNNFRRHPQNAACWLLKLMIATPSTFDGGQTEIADFYRIIILMEKNIVGFQISVDDVFSVEVVHALSCLTRDVHQFEHFMFRV